MSEDLSRKFRFSDIIKKLNESAPTPAAGKGATAAPEARAVAGPEASIPRPASALPDALPPQPNFGPAGPRVPQETVAAPQAQEPDRSGPAACVSAASGSSPTAAAAAANAPAQAPFSGGEKGEAGEEEEESFDIYRYLGVLVRRKFVILAATAVTALFSLHAYLTSGKQYIAHARLLFSPGRQEIVTDEYSAWAMLNDREQKLNTHMELLKSDQEVLQRVALALENRVSPVEVGGGLSVARGQTGGRENDIIEVKYTHGEAEIARDVVNQVCVQYVDYIREVEAQDIIRVIGKFEEQIRKVEGELKEKEDNLRLFKEKNRFVELSSQASALVTKTAELEASLQQTQLELQENRERIVSMQSQIGKQEIDIINSVTYQDLYKNRLSELQFELNTLLAEYSRDHYKVKMAEKEIERIKDAIRSQVTTKTVQSETFIKNPVRESLVQSLVALTIDKASLEAKRAAQEQIIAQQRDEMMKLPLLEQKYATLQRETESLLQTLQMLKSQYEKVKIKRDSQETDLKILQLSQTPHEGIRSVKINRVYMGLLIGLIIGIALAFLFEYLDQTIKEPRELERGLDLPLLGVVPQIEGEKAIIDAASSQGRTRLEPFRVLRTNLKHLAAVHNLKTLIICSAVKGEGKTTLAVNLAISFAMDGKKVILVDGDLRRPQIHAILGIAKEAGLSDYLTGAISDPRHILKRTQQENLQVITSGERPHHPTELLGTVRFQQLADALKAMAEIVIFDSPALLPVSDGMTMAPKMDGCVIIARTLWTPMKAARQAKAQLERISTKILGAILNGISHSRGYYPYYYGYYRYYAYKYTYEYDEDPRRKSAVRVLGLKTEAWLRDVLMQARHTAPRFAIEVAKELKMLALKKRFWLLIALFIGSSLLVPWIQERRHAFLPAKIQYLSNAKALTPHGQGNGLSEGVPLESFRGKPSAAALLHDTIASDAGQRPTPLEGPQASMEAWRSAFIRNEWQSCRQFYDSAAFRFPGGGFAQYELEAMRDKSPEGDTGLVGRLKAEPVNDSLWKAAMEVGASPRRAIVQMWRRSAGRWLIVAEKRDLLP